jgi:transcriptional regulator with GAF, ATPase, and Fis domain
VVAAANALIQRSGQNGLLPRFITAKDLERLERLAAALRRSWHRRRKPRRSRNLLGAVRAATERAVLAEALRRGGSQQAAARLLGVAQATVSRKADRYGL